MNTIVKLLLTVCTMLVATVSVAQQKPTLRSRVETGGACYTCSSELYQTLPCVTCIPHDRAGYLSYAYTYDTGYQNCTAHNPACDGVGSGSGDQGPPWCETYGFCWFCSPNAFTYLECSDNSLTIRTDEVSQINRAAEGILKYFLDARLMTPETLVDFIAETDRQIDIRQKPGSDSAGLTEVANARYGAYRDTFQRLMGQKLAYGFMPVYPRPIHTSSAPGTPHQRE